ncbi:MAG: hypothetical protein ABFR89_11270 [Actinomycetota bacterium]
MRRAMAAGFVVLALGSCSNAGAEPSTAEMACGSTIGVLESARTDEGYQWILDAIALPEPGIQHETGRTDPETGLRFAKMGLLVKPGHASTITVDPDQQAEIRLGWGNIGDAVGHPDRPVERLVIPACGGDEDFLIYGGGVWISEPACVALTVETSDQSEPVLFPIDTDCP